MSSSAVDTLGRRLAAVREALAALPATLSSTERRELLIQLGEVTDALTGSRLSLLHDEDRLADPPGAAVDWLHHTNTVSRRAARAMVRLAADLADRYPLIGEALRAGAVSEAQTRAIVSGLAKSGVEFTVAELATAQRELIRYAAEFDPDELHLLAVRYGEVLAPDRADEIEASRLAREAKLARAGRSFVLVPDHHGSMRIRGQLPIADGELLLAQLDALTPSANAYLEERERPGMAARRADALVRLTGIVAATGSLPARGGDRPQVIVTLSLETLLSGLGRAGALASGESLAAGDARRLACDAHIIPVTLDGGSRPLDVGASRRLFSASVRTALALRDQGCAFPGCTAPPAACDAHHIVPWWAGGASVLGNAVLLCPYHHRVVEPDLARVPGFQWQVHLDPVDGMPWFTPPRQIDPRRRPRRHHRHRLRGPVPIPAEETLPRGDPPVWDDLPFSSEWTVGTSL